MPARYLIQLILGSAVIFASLAAALAPRCVEPIQDGAAASIASSPTIGPNTHLPATGLPEVDGILSWDALLARLFSLDGMNPVSPAGLELELPIHDGLLLTFVVLFTLQAAGRARLGHRPGSTQFITLPPPTPPRGTRLGSPALAFAY